MPCCLLNSFSLSLSLYPPFPPFMLPCCPGSTSINKAQGTKCFWMGASCWQDLKGLFIEGLVSCYHWDVAACGNSGENRPLMPPPLGTAHSVLLFSLWWSSVKCSSATGGGCINTHIGEERRRTHTANSPKLAAHISPHTCSTPPLLFLAAVNSVL